MTEIPEEKQKEVERMRTLLKKEENRRKILYAENELTLIRKDARDSAILLLVELARKYDISSEDMGILIEVSYALK